MTRRPRWVRLAVRTAPLGVATVLVAVLAQLPAGATFTAQTDDHANVVDSAGDFCARTDFLSPVATAGVDQTAPDTPQPTDTLLVRSAATGDARAWFRFPLPAHEPWCVLGAATLRVWVTQPDPTRTIDAQEGSPTAPPWTTGSLTWNSQPARTGGVVGGSFQGTPGYQVWGVTPFVADQYASGNSGLVLEDRYEQGTGTVVQYSGALTGATAAQLQLDWH